MPASSRLPGCIEPRTFTSGAIKYATRHRMLDVNPLLVDRVKIKGKRHKRVDIPDRSDMERLREHINGCVAFTLASGAMR